jgi:uncharacterized protein YbaR (Trm112 family)
MKRELLKIICCPTCKGDLALIVEKEENGDILTGSFTCAHCQVTYPIIDGIPDLLPRDSETH